MSLGLQGGGARGVTHVNSHDKSFINFCHFVLKSMSIDTTNSSVVLDKLMAGVEYCTRVHMMIRTNQQAPSSWVCAWTSVPEPSKGERLMVF